MIRTIIRGKYEPHRVKLEENKKIGRKAPALIFRGIKLVQLCQNN